MSAEQVGEVMQQLDRIELGVTLLLCVMFFSVGWKVSDWIRARWDR